MGSAAEVFHRQHLPVFRWLRRMTGSQEQAEDLTQEVFLRVVRTITELPPDREAAWVFTIARNLWLNRRRDRARRPVEITLAGAASAQVPARSMEAIDLGAALAALDETDRETFLLRELGGLGYAEIAAVCELSPDGVRSRIYRARCALRESLSGAKEKRG
ncbi:MAG TPA: RNA polymerase sigma factor [Candidatus Polarisedimenticolaceae bacterium]|nr:RNA polymerase sigma factor [Candidatus Polarisedimenticolaceae bacterium]